MKKINLHPLKAHSLMNEDMYALSRNTLDTAMSFKEYFNRTVLAAFEKLDEYSEKLASRMKQVKYKELTKQITALNRECDKILAEMKIRVKAARESIVDLPLAEKAKKANTFIEPYKNTAKLAQSSQFQMTAEMLEKLAADAEMMEIFTELGNEKVIAALTVKNQAYAEAWNERNDLIGDRKELENATTTKQETAKAYNAFCNALFQQYSFQPTDTLHALISDINAIRARYAAMLAMAETARDRNK